MPASSCAVSCCTHSQAAFSASGTMACSRTVTGPIGSGSAASFSRLCRHCRTRIPAGIVTSLVRRQIRMPARVVAVGWWSLRPSRADRPTRCVPCVQRCSTVHEEMPVMRALTLAWNVRPCRRLDPARVAPQEPENSPSSRSVQTGSRVLGPASESWIPSPAPRSASIFGPRPASTRSAAGAQSP